MNLRNVWRKHHLEYNIGLDMGTGSVGWAVTDETGRLLHFKRQPAWGSRLFDSAQTAASARIPRSQRRRYVRRRWRLDLLQTLFQDEAAKVDPEFFIRLRQSRLLKEDREEGHADYRYPLFNDADFSERGYYTKFPTIYHLRKWLMETDEKADIRLIYLACHNIVKHRGNFLRQGQNISAKSADASGAIGTFYTALKEWCESRGYEPVQKHPDEVLLILSEDQTSASDKRKRIARLIDIEIGEDKKGNSRCATALASAMVGLKTEFKNIFGDFAVEQTSISFSDDAAVESLRSAIPDDCADLFESLYGVYAAYVLQGLLSYAPGECLSVNMVCKYEQYGEDLRLLKGLVHEYVPRRYDEFFRGPKYPGANTYDVDAAAKAKGYTAYNLGTSELGYDDFKKSVEKLFGGTSATEDERYKDMMTAFGRQQFLRRLKTSDNGSIYYQLHLEELHDILENQGRFYPFLKEQEDKIESLVSFRIPYYVGPLSMCNAALDHNGNRRFAWSERREGQESAVITPWNWDQVIDTDKSAENFIKRMTGTCTYLQGESVLPRSSLLYEEFCVLNELNGLRVTCDGDEEHRLDAADREGIVRDLFHRKRRVSYKDIEAWLKRNGECEYAHVLGGQGETALESNLGSYLFFCKDVFHVEELDPADYGMVEEIILWNTLFEDRDILKRKLVGKYGSGGQGSGLLSEQQIKAICKKRLTGWGRLSKKFLTGVTVPTEMGPKSMMDVLREGDPNSTSRRGRTMVMMEALRDKDLGFQDRVDELNRRYFEEHAKSLAVNELPGSPAIRRSINQALRIVDEIAKIAGHAPANIFVEVTRDDDERNRGKRTKRRYESLMTATEQLKEELRDTQVLDALKGYSSGEVLDDERLMLYFAQHGKSLYSGRPIDINRLSTGDYEVDHIIPRAYIKDDSLENKALVYREENQRKTDELLIDPAIRRQMGGYWRALHEAGLIGDKKYRNLLRDHVSDNMMKGFISRQLVETSQMVKLVQPLLEARYPDTMIVPVKASISSNLRDAVGFVKCREANDYHHAHDAFLACRVGLFIQMRHPQVYDHPIALAHAMRAYARSESRKFNKDHRMPGSSGFIVNSFLTSGFDKETGEVFRDDWNAEAEVEVMRKALNYRQCFISRMPHEDGGAFWDATIYSPRDKKKGARLSLPLKRDLDPSKYGGYSSEQFAYFFVYEAKKPGKGNRLFRFEGVPVSLASHLNGNLTALEDYAQKLCEDEGLDFVRIERRKILKRQLIEVDGDRLIVTGIREVRSGGEVAFSVEESSLLRDLAIRHFEDVGDEDLDHIFESVCSRGFQECRRLGKQLHVEDLQAPFSQLNKQEKGTVLLGIIRLVNGKDRVVDLSALGKASKAGAMGFSYGKQLSDLNVDFYIIDQSVTGMFERRTRIGL